MTITLNTKIHLFDGHVRNALSLGEPIWTGTMGDFWADNAEAFPHYGDIRNVADELAYYHQAHIGGGAGAKFTVVTEAFLALSKITRAAVL